MEEGEKKIKQEDCSEDNLGSGILTLTNKRLAFDKTRSRLWKSNMLDWTFRITSQARCFTKKYYCHTILEIRFS